MAAKIYEGGSQKKGDLGAADVVEGIERRWKRGSRGPTRDVEGGWMQRRGRAADLDCGGRSDAWWCWHEVLEAELIIPGVEEGKLTVEEEESGSG